MVGSVSCALVRWLGMTLMLVGTDPQTPDFMYFYVFYVLYIIYLTLVGAYSAFAESAWVSAHQQSSTAFWTVCIPSKLTVVIPRGGHQHEPGLAWR